MRDIRFRAWDMVQKCYFPVDTIMFLEGGIKVNGPGYGEGWVTKNDKFKNKIYVTVILEQFTGLKDKNGLTDIYEGDIIGVNGLLKGNLHEDPSLLQDEANLLIKRFGTKDWFTTYQKAVDRGCHDSK